MRKHTKVYVDYFGWADFYPCEVCGARAVDIHHIEARGMGGRKSADKIENLMALCRSCHLEYGDKRQHMEFLKKKHQHCVDNHVGKNYL
jgi:5-methylcytosine-specific restriction endonuclease McrA